MKVALFEKPHALSIRQASLRAMLPNEVLLKVEACGVCGTDVHIVEGTSRSTPPVVLGHEFTGIVEDVGSGVKGVSRGQRASVDPNISCGTCFYCRRGLVHLCERLLALGVDIDGGMAEYCLVPSEQLYLLPDGMRTEAAAFVEPVSCALHGVDRARIASGDTVVIVGGGTIGLLMLQLVQSAGAGRTILVEPIEEKRRIASALKADVVINPLKENVKEAVMDLTQLGADVVIECVGKPQTAHLSVDLARRGGTVEFFGVCPIGEKIEMEPNQVYFRELTVVGSYVNPHTFSRAVALLHAGKVRIDEFRVDRFPLDGVHEALEYQKEGKTLKSMIEPNR